MIESEANKGEQEFDGMLVVRAKTSSSAMSVLYERYYPRIYLFCLHRLHCVHTAEDITASIFLDVARGIKRFRGSREDEFFRWLYAIAVNRINGHLRKTIRRKQLFESIARIRISEYQRITLCVQDVEYDYSTVYSAITKLPLKDQTIITLRFFEGLDFSTIAGIVGGKASSLRTRLARSLKKLRKELIKSQNRLEK